jgi:hypothetical protein
MPEEETKRPNNAYGLPSNSHKSKSPEPKVRPEIIKITSTEVVRKKPLGRKIRESFMGDDAQSVGSFILFDVVIPAAKSLILDMFTQGLERSLYGDSHGRSKLGGSRSGRGGTSYQKMYNGAVVDDRGRRDERRELSYQQRSEHNFDDVILSNRGEAEEVLERLQDLVNDYDQAAVADLYSMIGVTPSYTDNKWGWTDIRGSRVDAVRGGYLLVLPRTTQLD